MIGELRLALRQLLKSPGRTAPARHFIRGLAAGLTMCVVVGEPRAQDALLTSAPPMTLQGAIQQALARNKQIKVESYAKTISRANLLAEWGAAGQVETTQRRIETAQRAYWVGQEALNAEVKKLRSGYSTTFVVLQLQEDMIDLESRVAQALADHRRAVAAYDREIGTTLERNDVTLAQD